MENIFALAANYGVSVFIAVYYTIYINKALRQQTESLNALTKAIDGLKSIVKGGENNED